MSAPKNLSEFIISGRFQLPIPNDFKPRMGVQKSRCCFCGFPVSSHGYRDGRIECLYCAWNRGDRTHPLPTHFDPALIEFLKKESRTDNHLGLLKWINENRSTVAH